MENKLETLKSILASMERIAVAFSGGVDSTFLLKVAKEVLGDQVIAVTARSDMFISFEYTDAKSLAEHLNVPLMTVDSNALDLPNVWKNPPDRCYHCKKAIFSAVLKIAGAHHMKTVVDGTHAGDTDDYRPGMKALEELGVRSPLKEANLTKAEIRQLSQKLSLPTHNKPSMACLASRFPYGVSITKKTLQQVARAETVLRNLGFESLRVRHHDTLARIEVPVSLIEKCADSNIRNTIIREFKKLGYHYITLDLQGFRSGSMNEVL